MAVTPRQERLIHRIDALRDQALELERAAAAEAEVPPLADGSYTLDIYSVLPGQSVASAPATLAGDRVLVNGVALPGIELYSFDLDEDGAADGAIVEVRGGSTLGQLR